MAFTKNHDPLPINRAACMHLRSKAMIVTGERDPDELDEEGSHYYWCNLSQHSIGPDSQGVGRRNCVPGRKCYCAIS